MDQKDGTTSVKDSGKEADLREFDFDDIITDDLPQEDGQKSTRPQAPAPDRTRTGTGSSRTVSSQEAKARSQQTIEEQEVRAQRRKRAKRRRAWKVSTGVLSWVKDIALAVLVIWVLTRVVAGFITMDNTSMEPTMKSGERFVYSRLNYHFTTLQRDEIIVFSDADSTDDSRVHIARVIGLPGDTVVITSDGAITVNGIAYQIPSEDGNTSFVTGQLTYPYTVPADCYFVLCDNPIATSDSRYRAVGAVNISRIKGKVFFCYWPKDSWRPITEGLIDNNSQ